jgi:C-terminal processing protease CtpA/Prc
VKSKGPFSLDSINNKTDAIFKAVKKDGVTSLIIDVSHNEGGNSAVGDYIIAHIYSKPYLGYQSTWKRSDEYLKLLKSWGLHDSVYEAVPVGKMLMYAPGTIVPRQVTSQFKGKVYVVVGRNTFSSAMLFATLIKDNHIAVIAGQIRQNGHPNGFGELYNTKLPNSKIDLRFGVKEWIRPAGKNVENELYPDIILANDQMADVTKMVNQLK